MNTETVQARAARLVQQEVYLCVSSIVSTLASGYGRSHFDTDSRQLGDLCEQALDLASPVLDWEEAAFQAGWEGPNKDGDDGQTYWQDKSDDMTWCAPDAETLCAAHDIEPYDREVFEHWAVSDWLADKLIEHGEKVDKDFAGLNVWARTTTGQAISIDGVIETIVREILA